MWIVVWAVMSMTVGGFMAIAFTTGMKNKIGHTVIAIIIAIAIGAAVTGMFYLESRGDETAWNDGHCELCKGEWELASTTKTRHGSVTYYWSCKNCGHVIKTKTNFK